VDALHYLHLLHCSMREIPLCRMGIFVLIMADNSASPWCKVFVLGISHTEVCNSRVLAGES